MQAFNNLERVDTKIWAKETPIIPPLKRINLTEGSKGMNDAGPTKRKTMAIKKFADIDSQVEYLRRSHI